jgi:hypothetical protein
MINPWVLEIIFMKMMDFWKTSCAISLFPMHPNFILFPDPVDVIRPGLPGSAEEVKTIKPKFREDGKSPTGYSFWYPENFWGLRKKLPPDAIWDDIRGRYCRRYKNGRVVDWSNDYVVENLYQKRVVVKLNGAQFNMDYDMVDMICHACPESNVTTADNKEYWPLEEPDLMKIVTKTGCQCAEFLFMRIHSHDKMSRNCRHMKLLISGEDNHLTCDICYTSEHDSKTDMEIFQFCETPNCDNMVCGSCYDSIMDKSAMCPYCRVDL